MSSVLGSAAVQVHCEVHIVACVQAQLQRSHCAGTRVLNAWFAEQHCTRKHVFGARQSCCAHLDSEVRPSFPSIVISLTLRCDRKMQAYRSKESLRLWMFGAVAAALVFVLGTCMLVGGNQIGSKEVCCKRVYAQARRLCLCSAQV